MKIARLSGFAVVTAGLVIGQLAYAPSANAAEQVLDGGFEASDEDGDSPNWTEADSLLDTPLCDEALCGADLARTGDWFAWFGGLTPAGHSASISQSVTIPAGTHALGYWIQSDGGTAPLDATLQVKVDGNTLKTYTEQASPDPDYSLQLIDIGAFANGSAHTVSFNYLNGAAGLTSWFVDDVSIETTLNPATTATPTVTATDPASPAPSATPKVQGTAEAGSTVTLYGNNTCTGPVYGSGTAAAFSGAGITATVALGSTTTFYAQATKANQFDSVCSTTSVSYVNNAPTTGTPTVTTTTDPASPSSSTTPKVKGTAEAGSTVTLYGNATCTGTALGSGSAATFMGAGITATVPNGATTTIYAKATKAGQIDSACSTTFASYVNDSTLPNTTISSPAAGAVVKSLTVPIAFTSSEANSTFTCKMDAGAFATCTSGASLTVSAGQHTLSVVAKDNAGNADDSPAAVTFTAYDCKTLIAAAADAQAKADAADKKVKKAKKALKKAKKSGNASKIKKAKKKLKKASKAAKAAKAALAAAQTGAAPCGGTVMKAQAHRR